MIEQQEEEEEQQRTRTEAKARTKQQNGGSHDRIQKEAKTERKAARAPHPVSSHPDQATAIKTNRPPVAILPDRECADRDERFYQPRSSRSLLIHSLLEDNGSRWQRDPPVRGQATMKQRKKGERKPQDKVGEEG